MSKTRFDRYVEAYYEMAAKAKYRPAARSDGFGNIPAGVDYLNDPNELEREANTYAKRIYEQDNKKCFQVQASSNYRTNRALVYVLEAAANLCAVQDDLALKLLRMAINDIKGGKKWKFEG